MSGLVIQETIDEMVKHLVSGRIKNIMVPPGLTPVSYAEYTEMQKRASIEVARQNPYSQTIFGNGVKMTLA